MATYRVKTPLSYNGTDYEPGKPVDLDEKTGNHLLQEGVVLLPEDYEAQVAADDAAKKAQEARERVGAPKAPAAIARAEKKQENKAAEEAASKPILPEGGEDADPDKKGVEGEQPRPDGSDL